MMSFYNLRARCHTKKEMCGSKPKKSIQEKKKAKNKKLLNKRFPFLKHRFINNRSRGIYQHSKIK
jgi:hypothetical protein